MSNDDLTRLPEEEPKSSLLSAGQTFGQYKVIRLLGRGGMGEVYEVENPVLEKRYALKLLNKEIMSRPDAAERFKREAKVMARFEHPNIVKVDDFGEIEGHAVLRMELIQGGALGQSSESGVVGGEFNSLDDLLTGEPLPEALVVDLLKQILDGLSYAHGKGVIHRDLKPSNLLLQSLPGNFLVRRSSSSEGGSGKKFIPKITDFGLVSLAGADWLQSQVQLTVARSMTDPDITRLEGSHSEGSSTKALMGTYAYMSPEQKKGAEVDHRSDLYAIGLIGFQMLTGEETPGFEMPSEMVEGISEDWDAWVKQALAPRAEKRFSSANDMVAKLPKLGVVGLPKNDSPDIEPEISLATEMVGKELDEENEEDVLLELPDGSKCSLVAITSGTFQMGSPLEEENRDKDEDIHEVTISCDFWIGATLVTQAQWKCVMGSEPSYFNGPDFPVEQVSWVDAMEFCSKLTKFENSAGRLPDGYEYSLPTEAQWEYACRAGTTGAYAGDLDLMGWYKDNSKKTTHSVAQKTPNANGIFDMHGNVWEWCQDWYSPYPADHAIDCIGPLDGQYRVIRGGSWDYAAGYSRSAFRYWLKPSNRTNNIGFRLALTPVQQEQSDSEANAFAKPPPGWTGD